MAGIPGLNAAESVPAVSSSPQGQVGMAVAAVVTSQLPPNDSALEERESSPRLCSAKIAEPPGGPSTGPEVGAATGTPGAKHSSRDVGESSC